MWGWGMGWFPFSGLGWILGLVVIGGIFRLLVFGRMGGWGPRSYRRWGWFGGPFDGPAGGGYGYGGAGYSDAEETLRQRLAKGEIDEAEYRRLLEVLKR